MQIKRKAQMSLIMLLVVALALVFFAISINWSRISAYKTQVTVASNTGAGTLVSMMASYGNTQILSTMGGSIYKEEWTGMAKAIAGVILAVLAVVVTVISAGSLSALSGWALTFAISMVASAVSGIVFVVIEAASTNPSITKFFNKQIADIPTMEGQFVEQAIQGMFSGVVTDDVKINDRWDMDMDGHWYNPTYPNMGDPNAKKITRFAYYYGDRLKGGVRPPVDLLQEVLKDMQKNLGLPAMLRGNEIKEPCRSMVTGRLRPECNACCQAPVGGSYDKGITKGRPGDCDQTPYLDACAVDNPACKRSSLNACFIYDPLYERTGNLPTEAPYNFMFVFGEDDPDAQRDDIPNGAGKAEEALFQADNRYIDKSSPRNQDSADGGVFRGSNAAGEFFPLLWLLADTQPNVKNLSITGGAVTDASPACHWRSKDSSQTPACKLKFAADTSVSTLGRVLFRPSPASVAYDQLTGLNNCQGQDCYINLFRNNLSGTATFDSRKIDAVGNISVVDAAKDISAFTPVKDSVCPATSPSAGKDIWKRGSDRNNQSFEYMRTIMVPADMALGEMAPDTPTDIFEVASIKFMSGDSFNLMAEELFYIGPQGGTKDDLCGVAGGNLRVERWRNDGLDLFGEKLAEFTRAAMAVVTMSSFEAKALDVFINGWGALLKEEVTAFEAFMPRLNAITTGMDTWLAGTGGAYKAVDLWCLPPDNAVLTQEERDYFVGKDSATGQVISLDPATKAAPVLGSVASVLQCLAYNSNNHDSFDYCYNHCSLDPKDKDPKGKTYQACLDLPRTLLPGFDPNNDPSKNTSYTVYFKIDNTQCLKDLKAAYTTTNVDVEAYKTAVAACSAAACSACVRRGCDQKQAQCIASRCDSPYSSCSSTPDPQACTNGVLEGCIKSSCESSSGCTTDTCIDPYCKDDACIAKAWDDHMKEVFDEDGYNREISNGSCPDREESKPYDACTIKRATLMAETIDGTWVSRDGPRDSDYMRKIADSRSLAFNQSKKFAKRYEYLKDLRDRVLRVRTAFNKAYTYLTTPMSDALQKSVEGFLPSSVGKRTPPQMVRDLVDYLDKWFRNVGSNKPGELSNDVVYGWFSPNKNGIPGTLHIVRVQAVIPGFMGTIGKTFPITQKSGYAKEKPKLETDTQWGGNRRYYQLNNPHGAVGARVIRYDQDHSGKLNFLSGLPLWNIKYNNPDSGMQGSADGDVESVRTKCSTYYKLTGDGTYKLTGQPDKELLKEAFMFQNPIQAVTTNDPKAVEAQAAMKACAEPVLRLLRRGVASETCAYYYPRNSKGSTDKEDKNWSYDIKFVPCK